MKITNRLNLPEPIVNAVRNDSYHRGECDLSITGLISPPRIIALYRDYADEISEDVADRLWALYGQAVHEIIRRASAADPKTKLHEERIFFTINGVRLSGQIDRYTTDLVLQDYKFISANAAKFGVKREWEQQLNCYSYALSTITDPPEKLQIVALYRDWNEHYCNKKDYPKDPVEYYDVNLWDKTTQLAFIEERIELWKQAHETLPNCSPEEQWRRGSKYEIRNTKTGDAFAVKSSLSACQTWISNNLKPDSGGYEIVTILGEPLRCQRYCPVSRFCKQYESEKSAK